MQVPLVGLPTPLPCADKARGNASDLVDPHNGRPKAPETTRVAKRCQIDNLSSDYEVTP